jgi:curved DNA-binding protein CbpA
MRDPYEVLGVSPAASETELRAAYHKLVKRHHPDHNDGSPESARDFEEVQEAYARIRETRAAGAIRTAGMHAAGGGDPGASAGGDDSVAARLADLERQVREAQAARAQAEAAAADARRRARAAASDAAEREGRPSDEELGYVTTDDSFSKIFDDAASKLGGWLSEAESEVSDRLTGAQGRSARKRLADLAEEIEERLRRRPPR